jgi:phosphoribosylformylglycinamidine (FGAM) synthase-like enzyme
MGDTVVTPGLGAGVIRVHGTNKALAFTSDVTPRYVKANPVEGGKQAVAEAYRNLICTGARPLATTDNMNFGNPEKPEIMGQFVGAIQGIGAACLALDVPIVSGNVSLYNETDGDPILPTPTIGAVGLIDDIDTMIAGVARAGHQLIMLGASGTHLGQSALLNEVFNRQDGDAPAVDLDQERALGDFIQSERQWIDVCTDLSDGGLILAAFEIADAAGCGVTLHPSSTAELFGEDQARYLISCSFDKAEALMTAAGRAGIAVSSVGQVGGADFTVGRSSAPLAELSALFNSSFEAAVT